MIQGTPAVQQPAGMQGTTGIQQPAGPTSVFPSLPAGLTPVSHVTAAQAQSLLSVVLGSSYQELTQYTDPSGQVRILVPVGVGGAGVGGTGLTLPPGAGEIQNAASGTRGTGEVQLVTEPAGSGAVQSAGSAVQRASASPLQNSVQLVTDRQHTPLPTDFETTKLCTGKKTNDPSKLKRSRPRVTKTDLETSGEISPGNQSKMSNSITERSQTSEQSSHNVAGISAEHAPVSDIRGNLQILREMPRDARPLTVLSVDQCDPRSEAVLSGQVQTVSMLHPSTSGKSPDHRQTIRITNFFGVPDDWQSLLNQEYEGPEGSGDASAKSVQSASATQGGQTTVGLEQSTSVVSNSLHTPAGGTTVISSLGPAVIRNSIAPDPGADVEGTRFALCQGERFTSGAVGPSPLGGRVAAPRPASAVSDAAPPSPTDSSVTLSSLGSWCPSEESPFKCRPLVTGDDLNEYMEEARKPRQLKNPRRRATAKVKRTIQTRSVSRSGSETAEQEHNTDGYETVRKLLKRKRTDSDVDSEITPKGRKLQKDARGSKNAGDSDSDDDVVLADLRKQNKVMDKENEAGSSTQEKRRSGGMKQLRLDELFSPRDKSTRQPLDVSDNEERGPDGAEPGPADWLPDLSSPTKERRAGKGDVTEERDAVARKLDAVVGGQDAVAGEDATEDAPPARRTRLQARREAGTRRVCDE